jgi:hypothetical protein
MYLGNSFACLYEGLVRLSIYKESKTKMLVMGAMTRGAVLLFLVMN